MRQTLCASLLLLFVHFGGTPSSAQAPVQQNPALAKIQRALQSGDHEGAIGLAEEFVDAAPENGAAWLLLGQALELGGRWEDATEIFGLAAEYAPQAAQANFGLAKLGALHASPEEAIARARAALDAGLPLRQIWVSEELQALSKSKAFSDSIPKPRAPRECFSENVRILHTFYGEKSNDVFGWIGRNVGDADGDGKADLLISAPYNSEGGPGAGKVYLYSGASGELLFSIVGKPHEGLGMGIEAAGDLDADGLQDIFVGAPTIGYGPGSAYVYSGKNGSLLRTFTHGEVGDLFGQKGIGGVDFDDDGVPDFLIGAPGAGQDGSGPGRAFVYSGKTGLEIAHVQGERPGDGFGAANDVWSDGTNKLVAIGAGKAGDRKVGRVYVYRFVDGNLTKSFSMEPDATGSALGAMFVAFAGDMDGDGISEVYAADWANAAKGTSTGRIYIHSGKSGKRLFSLTGDSAGEGFGTCTADVGDVDGDGVADLLVGAWQESSAAKGGGKCTLYSMKTRTILATYTSNVAGETLGFDTTGVGDLDGDGGIDFLVTGGYSPVMGFHSGRAFVIAGPVPKR